MTNDPLSRAALSAAIVGLLLTLLRRAGPRAGGLAAAVPVSSLPALFWLSAEHGGRFAAAAASGALWSTGLTVVLALVFARLAMSLHAALATLVALLATTLAAIATRPLAAWPAAAGALTLAAIAVAQQALPQPVAALRRHGAWRTSAPVSIAMAGVMTFVTSVLSRHGGPALCGVVAAIPVVAMSTVFAAQLEGGVPMTCLFLRGYLDGMLAKAAFLVVLSVAWGAGAGASAWPVALAASGAALMVQRGWRERRASA